MSIVKDLLLIVLFLIVIFTMILIDNGIAIFSISTGMVFFMLFSHIRKFMFMKKELIRQREYFIKTLSHDLKVSTLAQIRGLDLLQKNVLQGENCLELISDINDSCKYTLDMITMLLNTYRFENGEQVLNYEKVNISELVFESCQKMFNTAGAKGIDFYYNIEDSGAVDADKNALKKVLLTLISTALFYSEKNCNLAVFVKKLRRKFEVTISYCGKPLTDEECRRMFSNNPRFSTVGHGIRMHLCKKIIEFHGGDIRVINRKDKLNSFTFTLPAVKKEVSLKSPVISRLQLYSS